VVDMLANAEARERAGRVPGTMQTILCDMLSSLGDQLDCSRARQHRRQQGKLEGLRVSEFGGLSHLSRRYQPTEGTGWNVHTN